MNVDTRHNVIDIMIADIITRLNIFNFLIINENMETPKFSL